MKSRFALLIFLCILANLLYPPVSAAHDVQSQAVSAGPGVERLWSDLPNTLNVLHGESEAPMRYEMDLATLQVLKNEPYKSADNLPSTEVDDAASPSEPQPLAPTILRNFEGPDYLSGLMRPPDPNLAVGFNYVGVVVNSELAFYTKDGTLVNEVTFVDWWSNVRSGASTPFDPRIAYDHHADRWLMTALEHNSTHSYYLLSVSQTSDPTGAWWNYRLDGILTYSGEDTWADYPDLGFDGIADGAIYITSNQFTFTGPPYSFRTSMLNILPKSALYSGSGFTYWKAWGRMNADGSQAFTLRTAHTFGNPGGEFLINSKSGGWDKVTLWRVNPTFPPDPVDWVRQATVTIGSYSPPPNATQLGGSAELDTIDNRIYNSMYRNGYLYAAFTEAYDWGNGTVAAIRYLKIDTSTNSADLNVRYGADGYYYWFPAIYTDNLDNIAIVFARSSPTEYAGIRYTGRKTTDTTTQPSTLLKAGETYITGYRWGDYFGISNDPSDGSKVWIYGQWAKDCPGVSPDWDWGTWIGEVSLELTPKISVVNPTTMYNNFVFYTYTTSVGTGFNATIWVYNVTDLFAYQVKLFYNSTILNVTRAWVPRWDPEWVFYGRVVVGVAPWFGAGWAAIGESLLGSQPRFYGTGLLGIIEFEIIYAPTTGEVSSNLDINNVETYLLDYDINEIPTAKISGYYEYVWGAPLPEVYVLPKENIFFTDKTPLFTRFNVTVWVNNVSDLFAWQVRMYYNSTILNLIRAWHPTWNTDYVFYNSSTVQLGPVFGANYTLIGDTLTDQQAGFSGAGTLCVVEFEITKEPAEIGDILSATFDIDNVDTYLLDSYLNEISAIRTNGNYQYIWKGNLVATGIEPVQVVWGPIDLVQDKATDFRISYQSTFKKVVEADILIDAQGFNPNGYTFKHSFLPGTHSFVIGSEHPTSPFFLARNKPEATFKFTVDPANLIEESDETDNTFPGVDFKKSKVRDTKTLRILFVAVRFDGEDGHPGYFNGFSRAEFIEHAEESVRYFKATYPVAESEVYYYLACFNAPLNAGPRPTTESEANTRMANLIRNLAVRAGSYYDRVVGVVRNRDRDWFAGFPDDPNTDLNWQRVIGFSWKSISPKAVVVTLGYWKTTVHELGHTYDLGHSNDNGDGYYVTGRRSVDAQTFMSTGAISTPPAQPGYRKPVPTFWVRKTEYQTLLSKLTVRADPEILMVSGSFWRNGTIVLDNWYHFPSGTPDFEEGDTGNHYIVQIDSIGNVLSTIGFNVTFEDELHGYSFDEVPFTFTIPYANGTKTVQLLNATGHIVASKIISDNPPIVRVLSPNGGEILISNQVEVSWEASDADDDPLVYNLLISGDEGLTWNPIETDLQQTTYNLTLTGFSGGNKYLARVIASDGVNTGEDISDGFFTISSFTINVITPAQTLLPGERAYYSLNITSYGGFNKTITLNATSPTTNQLVFQWINGSTIVPVPNGSTIAMLEVEVPYSFEGGNHTIIIQAISGVNEEVATTNLFSPYTPDIALIDITTSKTIVGTGFSVYINVTVQNQGFYAQAFNITVYYNQSVLAEQEAYLDSGLATTLIFMWNTSGIAKGNYSISAYASPVLYETDITDNTFTDSWVVVAMVGDITGGTEDPWDFIPDGKVDIKDIAVVAILFGVNYPHPRYEPNCDLTGPTLNVADGKIDIRDIAMVAIHFGDIDP